MQDEAPAHRVRVPEAQEGERGLDQDGGGKFVKKRRGAAPGAVTYSQERTLHLRTEPARLARLLAEEEGAPT